MLNGGASLDDIGNFVLDLKELLEWKVRDSFAVAMNLEIVRVSGHDLDEQEVRGAGYS